MVNAKNLKVDHSFKIAHGKAGCLGDDVPSPGLATYRCMRGSSGLRVFHQWLRQILAASTCRLVSQPRCGPCFPTRGTKGSACRCLGSGLQVQPPIEQDVVAISRWDLEPDEQPSRPAA